MFSFLSSLLFSCIILLIWLFIISRNKFDIISPSSIATFMCFLFSIILLFSINKFNVDININTISILIFSIFIFSLPSLIFDTGPNIPKSRKLTFISGWLIYFSFIFILLSTFMYYKEVLKIATFNGFSSSSTIGMLYYYRNATLKGGNEIALQSAFVGQLVIASYSLAYINLVDFTKKLFFNFKLNRFFIIQLGIMLIFLVQTILSGGRTQFLYYIESFIFLIFYFYKQSNRKNFDLKLVNKFIPFILIIGLSFYFLGALTGKTNKLNFGSTLFAYTGSSFIAFDKLVNGQVVFAHNYYGSNVFIGLTSLIDKIGFSNFDNNIILPFVPTGSISTNIYGIFGRYYSDFGLIGMAFILFFLGSIYSLLYSYICNTKSKYHDFYLLVYLLLLKTVFDFPIEERFFTSVLSLGTLTRLFYLIIFYGLSRVSFVYGKRRINEKDLSGSSFK